MLARLILTGILNDIDKQPVKVIIVLICRNSIERK